MELTLTTSRSMKLEDLFEAMAAPQPTWYASNSEELEAVRLRRKLVYRNAFHRDLIGAARPGSQMLTAFMEEIGFAMKNGLTVSFCNHQGHSTVSMFISHADEAWRARALMELSEGVRADAWSDELEILQSRLLGYSDNQIVEWIKFQQWRRLGWKGYTIFALVSEEASVAIRKARSCFPDAEGGGVVFYSSSGQSLRRDAHTRVPAGTVLCRVAVAMHHEMFSTKLRDSGLPQRTMSRAELLELNPHLVSPIQILGPEGWS
jgi:hypothetical protein